MGVAGNFQAQVHPDSSTVKGNLGIWTFFPCPQLQIPVYWMITQTNNNGYWAWLNICGKHCDSSSEAYKTGSSTFRLYTVEESEDQYS